MSSNIKIIIQVIQIYLLIPQLEGKKVTKNHPTKVTSRIVRIRFHTNTIWIWVFPKTGVPQNEWFIMENPIKMDDLGVYTIFGNIHMDMSILPKAPLHAVAVHNRLAEGIEGTACHSSPPASKRLTLLRTPGWVKVSWQKEGWENMDFYCGKQLKNYASNVLKFFWFWV